VIRTALLTVATRGTKLPDWVGFEKMVAALRKKLGANPADFTISLPKNLPPEFRPVVEAARQSVLGDAPKLLDASLPARKLFDQMPAFMGRYFWLEDALSEVDHHDRSTFGAWEKFTGGNSDDGSLLTLFFCLAAHAAPKTLLTEKSAATLIRKVSKAGFKSEAASDYIAANAPAQYQSDYAQLWSNFADEARPVFKSDAVGSFEDALALLRRECNVQATKSG
jgi:hypothetical protein